jgi:ABC-type sulfate transport system permease subunit
MENIPALLLVIALIFAWKKPVIGGILFVIIGAFFTVFYNTYQRWDTFVLISLPIFLIGLLFLSNSSSCFKE